MQRADAILFAASAAISAGVLGLLWRWDVIRPGSFGAAKGGTEKQRQRDVTDLPTPIWLLGAIVMYLALIEGGLLASRLPASLMGTPKSLQQGALGSLVEYGVALVVGALALLLLRSTVNEGAGLRVRWKDIGRGVVAMVLLTPLCVCAAMAASAVAEWVSGTTQDPVQHETLKSIVANRASPWAWITAGCAVICAPIVEELIYRAFLQSCLLRTLGRTWPAIMGTSAIFAAMHFVGGVVPLQALAPLFVLSVGMGVAFERTRGIATSITMHMLFNAGNVALAMMM